MLKFLLALAIVACFFEISLADNRCSKANEVYEECPHKCPFRTCGIDDNLIDCVPQPLKGDPKCPEPKCRCKPHFFRDDKGNCVPWDQCPVCTGENEKYDPCDSPCPARRCDFDSRLVKCMRPPEVGDKGCVVGCRCKDGYYKNEKNVCVLWKDCTRECSVNEVLERYSATSPQTCADRHNILLKHEKRIPLWMPECRCRQGFLRNKDGLCIPEADCDKVCKENEVYELCPGCSKQTCATRNETIHCPLQPSDQAKCKSECRCKKGYYRDRIGRCIPEKDCDKCTKPHEFFECGGACDNVCGSKYNQDNCNIINIVCNPMCYCEKGYYRATNKTCIPLEDCKYECPVNEKYDECPQTLCQPKTCAEAGNPLDCAPRKEGEPCPGKPGCICKKGYLRNAEGVCVPSIECPSCKGDVNATLGCGVNCGRLCSNYNSTEPFGCIQVCYSNACDCRPDYVLDSNTDQCVLPKDCTPTCKKNEYYSTCINGGCNKKLCTDLNKEVVCIHPKICKTGCLCNPGYLRAKNGTCVPTKECDVPLPQCKPNQELLPCGLDGCKKKYCSDLDLPPLCRDTFTCNPSCECKDGFLRASMDDDTCIPIDKCKSQCPKNEVYVDCPMGVCSPQNCSQAGFPIKCAKYSQCPGKPGCICADGFLRNSKGVCIPKAQCPSCRGDKNAIPGCGVNCGNLCTNYKLKGQILCSAICDPNGCDCKDGFVFDESKKKCVRPCDCKTCSGPNEEYVDCPSGLCGPKTCKEAGFPVPCPIQSVDGKCSGEPGCVCQSGYLKNDRDICIPKDVCPSCGGDENAYPGCGTNCGRLCSNYNNTKNVVCPLICNLNGCDCKKDYVFDQNKKKCVKPCDCSPTCGINEEYTNCTSNIGRVQNCKDKGKDIPCPPKESGSCKEGCVCKKDFMRSKNGTCIPANECPNEQCTGPNERYVKCPSGLCEPKTCKEAGFPIPCPIQSVDGKCSGEPGCICNSGYLRNDKGICIPKNKCPSCGGDNNALPGCGINCGELCSNYNRKEKAICTLQCKLNGCDCKKGFVYDQNTKKCVKPCDCTPTCGINEEYSNCSNGLCRVQDCKDKGKDRPCPPMAPGSCKGGCVCKKDFLKSKNGTCIPADECPKEKCDKSNESYVECPSGLCQPQTCKEAGFPVPCPTQSIDGKCSGPPRCVCNSGYLRNNKGICVPKNQCPSCGGDKNAIPGCGTNCGRLCSNYKSSKKLPCPRICNANGCDCKKDFVYDSNRRKCVNPKDCTPTCQPTEVFSECANGLCRPQQCPDKGKNFTCPPMPKASCKPGCICDENSLRNKHGVCVPKDQCEKSQIPPMNVSTCNPEASRKDLEKGNAILTGKALYEVVKMNPGKSVFLSIFSLIPSLAQLALYSKGQTKKELMTVLNAKSASDIRCGYPSLMSSIKATEGAELDLAAKVYIYKQGLLSKAFSEDARTLFNAPAENVDFNDALTASDIINKWVSQATQNKIQELVKPDMFDSSTRIVLANAFYFKGIWKTAFNPNNTKSRDFYVNDKETKKVPTMTQTGNFRYAKLSDPDVQVLELPYEDTNMSCLIILPTQKNGLLSVVQKLQDLNVYQKILQSLYTTKVKVFLPKVIDLTTETNLKDLLSALGVQTIFDQVKAQLSGMTDPDQDLFVSSAVQECSMTMDEKGSVAAAANAVAISNRSLPAPRPEEIIFDANCPYAIMIKFGDKVLFSGTVANF